MRYIVALVYGSAVVVEADSFEAAARHAFGGDEPRLGWEAVAAPADCGQIFELAPHPKDTT